MAIDISGIYIFMPVFSFLFVFILIFAILKSTKILGDVPFANFFISFIMATIFISFSSLELYVQTVIPWFVVLVVCVFLILLIAGFASGKLENVVSHKTFGMIVIVVLIAVFLISAIKVFNPVFHPDLILASGEGTSLLDQLRNAYEGRVFGTLLLTIISIVVAWFITKK